jgi:hypothetical protein
MQRFERAASYLAAAAETLAEVVEPMAELHSVCWKYRLAIPRLLTHVPALQETVRILTMFGNIGMASPAPIAADE